MKWNETMKQKEREAASTIINNCKFIHLSMHLTSVVAFGAHLYLPVLLVM